MLKQITSLLEERGSLSVTELALALNAEPSAVRPMLAMLEKKGKIEQLELPCGSGCSSCNCADVDKMTYYQAKKGST